MTMMMRSTIALTALMGLLALTTGCGAKASNPGTAQATSGSTTETVSPPQGAGHADAAVVPGSHEDWCDEHLVAESQCTRCDPSLVPAFQAANDWCPDHGLPMSQCTIHDPNLKIVRPPKPVGN
jgi:hypothetical protein